MKLNSKSGAKIAMTAAALVVSSTALIASAFAVEGIPGRCFGVNGCAGKGGGRPLPAKGKELRS
jgi:hypothetical protein